MTTLKTTIKSSLKAKGINAAMACLMFVMLFASCNRPSASSASFPTSSRHGVKNKLKYHTTQQQFSYDISRRIESAYFTITEV